MWVWIGFIECQTCFMSTTTIICCHDVNIHAQSSELELINELTCNKNKQQGTLALSQKTVNIDGTWTLCILAHRNTPKRNLKFMSEKNGNFEIDLERPRNRPESPRRKRVECLEQATTSHRGRSERVSRCSRSCWFAGSCRRGRGRWLVVACSGLCWVTRWAGRVGARNCVLSTTGNRDCANDRMIIVAVVVVISRGTGGDDGHCTGTNTVGRDGRRWWLRGCRCDGGLG